MMARTKAQSSGAFKSLKTSPGFEDLWQLHYCGRSRGPQFAREIHRQFGRGRHERFRSPGRGNAELHQDDGDARREFHAHQYPERFPQGLWTPPLAARGASKVRRIGHCVIRACYNFGSIESGLCTGNFGDINRSFESKEIFRCLRFSCRYPSKESLDGVRNC